MDFVCGLYNEVKYLFTHIIRRRSIRKQHHKYTSVKGQLDGRKYEALFVLLHGRNSEPAQFSEHIEYLESKNRNILIFAPYIYKKGNRCTLGQCMEPIVEELRLFEKEHSSSPIVIVGISNGGRLSLELRTRLSKDKTIVLSTLVGVLNGTKWADLMYFLTKNSYFKDLGYNSQCAKDLLQRFSVCTNTICKMYAARNDLVIVPYSSSIPYIPFEVETEIVNNHNHNSIVQFKAKEQIDWCLDKMNLIR